MPSATALRMHSWPPSPPCRCLNILLRLLNDWLQYLGFLTFRPPVPAYKHSAAMFLKLRGQIECDHTHPQSPKRPESDRDILRHIVEQMPTA